MVYINIYFVLIACEKIEFAEKSSPGECVLTLEMCLRLGIVFLTLDKMLTHESGK